MNLQNYKKRIFFQESTSVSTVAVLQGIFVILTQ